MLLPSCYLLLPPCFLLFAISYPLLSTCYSLLATCYLQLAYCYLLFPTLYLQLGFFVFLPLLVDLVFHNCILFDLADFLRIIVVISKWVMLDWLCNKSTILQSSAMSLHEELHHIKCLRSPWGNPTDSCIVGTFSESRQFINALPSSRYAIQVQQHQSLTNPSNEFNYFTFHQ